MTEIHRWRTTKDSDNSPSTAPRISRRLQPTAHPEPPVDVHGPRARLPRYRTRRDRSAPAAELKAPGPPPPLRHFRRRYRHGRR